MNSFVILCLDDEPSIVERLRQDLSPFSDLFDIVEADSIDDANDTLAFIEQQGQQAAMVICDNDLGADNGVDFLVQLDNHPVTKRARTVLLNDKPQIDVIMQAVNEGRLNYCLTKPWQREELHRVLIKELTTYVIKHPDEDWLKYSQLLDHRRILKAHIDRQMSSFRSGFIRHGDQLDDTTLASQVTDALHSFFQGNDEHKACRTYSEGHVLTHEGEANSFLWFITRGEVALYKKDEDGFKHEVVRVGSGNLIGGMSFVTDEASFSTGITLCQTDVIKLDRQLFTKVMNSQSELLPLFTNLLLRNFNRRLQGSIKTEMRLQQTLKSLDEAYQELIDKEKMAMLGQLVAGVAHELNNPVSAILRGSDTLKETICKLTDSQLNHDNQTQGNVILQRAMQSRPLSTSEARQRAKQLEATLGDRQTARKAVLMGLDDTDSIERWLLPQKHQLKTVVDEWEHYYQMGNFLRSINVCAHRIADLVKSLKSYARQDDETTHDVDLHEGLEDTLVIFENRLKRHHVTKEYAELPHLRCQPIALQQVWTNLIANALDAVIEPGEIRITTQFTPNSHQQSIDILVEDNGKGIPQAQQEKVFELNYTTKREGNFGLGIGLSVCQQIIHQHNGTIRIESEPETFTRMIVTLPVHQNYSSVQAAPDKAASYKSRSSQTDQDKTEPDQIRHSHKEMQ
ncbi:ATP-binding protein [Photobacterium sanguinicancri]|uniref:histidine kinase n=1 Tax=Photobacterium sanguinicancri TaxID=875932 RepID=A0AAW7Y6F4_9GAMM|nr:ATP-binding protein [Photobacterium sanguinicancri]MDO6543059.1 ATP-binding protein [Photobacterium sanguinicancri]